MSLSEREKEVLSVLFQGIKIRDAGCKLGISEGTVRKHLNNIYSKLGVSNRIQLKQVLRERQIMSVPDDFENEEEDT